MGDFKDTEFVIVDVETTGLSPSSGDRMVEIAALKIQDLKPISQFHSLIDPERKLSAEAFAVNGITPQMLEGAPQSGEVLLPFLKYVKDAVLIGYNVKFDLGFIANELSFLRKRLDAKTIVIDALKMARGLLPDLGSYPLWYVARSLGIEQRQEHRAMADVEMTWAVFRKLLETAERKEINNIRNLVNLFAIHRGNLQKRDDEKTSLIEEAIQDSCKLSVGYFSPRSSSTTFRQITPKRIVELRGIETLVGFCHLREEERSFRLDRILHLEKL